MIGANAVVVKSIPKNSLVVGVPGRVIKQGISKEDYMTNPNIYLQII